MGLRGRAGFALAVVARPLLVGASLSREHRLRGGGVRAPLFPSVRDLPDQGLNPGLLHQLAGSLSLSLGEPMVAFLTRDLVCLNLEMARY